jgi:hypothetical protein
MGAILHCSEARFDRGCAADFVFSKMGVRVTAWLKPSPDKKQEVQGQQNESFDELAGWRRMRGDGKLAGWHRRPRFIHCGPETPVAD